MKDVREIHLEDKYYLDFRDSWLAVYEDTTSIFLLEVEREIATQYLEGKKSDSYYRRGGKKAELIEEECIVVRFARLRVIYSGRGLN